MHFLPPNQQRQSTEGIILLYYWANKTMMMMMMMMMTLYIRALTSREGRKQPAHRACSCQPLPALSADAFFVT